MFSWIAWKIRQLNDWRRDCGCSFKHLRDGSTLHEQCMYHYLES